MKTRFGALCGWLITGALIRALAVLYVAALCAAGAAAGAPPSHLTLHLPLVTDAQPRVGLAPEALGGDLRFVAAAEGAGALRLSAEHADAHGRVTHAPAEPLLRFPAHGLLNNAQGAVSFRIRAPRVSDAKAKDFPALLRLSGGGGGTWVLEMRETPYLAPDVKLSAAEAKDQAQEMTASGNLRLDQKADEAGGGGVTAGDFTAAPPVATVQCRVALSLWPEGEGASVSVIGSAPVREGQQTHQVLWTWRSLHHEIYINGRKVGAETPQNSISRLAPAVDGYTVLELLHCSADLSDLRLFNRWLPPEHAVLLAGLGAADALPELPPVRVWADWAASTGRSVVFVDAAGVAAAAAATVRCVAVRENRAMAETTLTELPDRLGEAVVRPFAPEPFPTGTYRFEAVVHDAAGNAVGHAVSDDWVCEEKPWPFLGFAGGRPEAAKTAVIPPFTAVGVEGRAVSTALRTHRIGRTGLFDAIVAAGEELLAGPVRLDVVAAGKPLVFDQGSGLGEIRRSDTAADWQAETRTAEGHALRVSAHLEYDGVTRFDVTLAPASPLPIARVDLIVPYREEVARLCHSGISLWFGAIARGADGAWSCKRTNWAGPGGERARRPDVLFDSFDKMLGLFPPVTRQLYTPYLHVGNNARGLSWFVDNDEHWLHDPAVPPLEFVARGDTPFLRLNLVARPVTLAAPLTWRFYLLANPFKPLPPKWRTWGVGTNRRTNELLARSDHLFWWHWSEYAGNFRPYPGPAIAYDGKAAAQDTGNHAFATDAGYDFWRDKFKGDDIRHLPFINFGTPGGFPGFTAESMVHPYTWKLHNNLPHRDYVAYWLDRCLRDIGIDGVYIDEPYCEPFSYNVLAGDEPYVRPDGTRALGFRFMEGRAYIRRLKQLFTDHGIDYSIWLHNTNYRALPVMTFADIGMDGEHPSIWVPEFDNYYGFYNPVQSRGYLAGRPFGFVGAQMYHGNTNPKGADAFARIYRKDRTYLAVTLPNGVLPMATTYPHELDRIQNLHAAFGLADDEPEELPLDALQARCAGFAAEPAFESAGALLLAERQRALLYFATPWPSNTSSHVLSGDLKPLGGGKPHIHLWNAENGASLRRDGQWVIDAPALDFVCVWAEGRDTPQPDRPEGVLLGVSFDRSLEADAGGGLLPVDTAEGKLSAASGRSGGGLAVGSTVSAPAYAVVPAWQGGSVQFDLRVERASTRPLALLRLTHHLACDLHLVVRDNVPGLLLTAMEAPLAVPVPTTAYSTGKIAPVAKSVFGKLPPAGAEGWRRIILTWQAGRYRLSCDGVEIAAMLDPVVPRLRDAQAPARGVQVGDGSAGATGAAVIDALWVYDWSLAPADVQRAQRAAVGVPVAPAPEGAAIAVWYDPASREALRTGAAFGRHVAADRVTHVRFLLFAGSGSNGKPIAIGEAVPWSGIAWCALEMKRPEAATLGAIGLGGPSGSVVTEYRLLVELLQRGHKESGGGEVLGRQECPVELDLFSAIDIR